MSNQEILRELERAHRNIGAVRLRMGIQKLLDTDVTEREDQVVDAIASLVRVQEKMRQVKRSKGRRL
jgi:hypothetical protein